MRFYGDSTFVKLLGPGSSMWHRLPVGHRVHKEEAGGELRNTPSCSQRFKGSLEYAHQERGMQPLELFFPTETWSSHHLSDVDRINSVASSHSFRSRDPAGQSTVTSREAANSAESSRSQAEAALRGAAPGDLVRPADGFFSGLEEWWGRRRGRTPWGRLGGRESRRTARSHALLYLALTDPALSSTALLSTDKPAQASCEAEFGKEERAQDSSLAPLPALLGFACVVLLFAFICGVAVGSALVRSRPNPGAVVIAAIPEGGTRPTKHEWKNDEEAYAAQALNPLVLAAGITKAAREPEANKLRGEAAKQFRERSAHSVKGFPSTTRPAFELVVPHAHQEARGSPALLKGAFKLYVPQQNQSWLAGTQSGAFMLEYIPAPRAGRLAEESCFFPPPGKPPAEALSEPSNTAGLGFSTGAEASKLLLNSTAGEELQFREFDEAGRKIRLDSAIPLDTKPLVGVSAAAKASVGLLNVEPSSSFLDSLWVQQHLSRGPKLKVRIRDAKDASSALQLRPHVPASQLLVNWGSFSPLQGDAVAAEGPEDAVTHIFERAHPESTPDQPVADSLPSMSAESVNERQAPLLEAPGEALGGRMRDLFEALVMRNKAVSSPTVRNLVEEEPPLGEGDSLQGREPDFEHRTTGLTPVPSTEGSQELLPSAETNEFLKRKGNTHGKGPWLLAASFHPMIDAQGAGFRAFEVAVTLNHMVSSEYMYQDLLKDCQLGRLYVQLSTALAHYTIFFWNDVEYHRYLPFPVECVVRNWPDPL
ncbi:hypothetical protein Efla_003114 [Eimeria flavescens]